MNDEEKHNTLYEKHKEVVKVMFDGKDNWRDALKKTTDLHVAITKEEMGKFAEWMHRNEYRKYGSSANQTLTWVSFNKTETDAGILTTQQIIDLYLNQKQ